MDRARNEIALVDKQTGKVIYGIDSLFLVIGHSLPVLMPLFKNLFFRRAMQSLYAFISYNRKVIIPSDALNDCCVPDVNLKFRWVYIFFTWLCTSIVLTIYSRHLDGIIPASRFFREFMVCGGQILFQSVFLVLIKKDSLVEYIGNMMTISFAGALSLLFVSGIFQVFGVKNPLVFAVAFLSDAGLMFLEHWRRMKLLDIHWFASISWVLYRVLILLFILYC
jgi:hypothetical protein